MYSNVTKAELKKNLEIEGEHRNSQKTVWGGQLKRNSIKLQN